jgi:hypothetical protein
MHVIVADPRLPRFAGAAPPVAFLCFVIAAVAVVPASASGSGALAVCCSAVLVATLAALTAAVLIVDRYRARIAGTKIHRLTRSGGRSPLLVFMVTAPDGRILDAAAYDPDDEAVARA